MTSPTDVAAFHAAYDRHPDDRIRLFGAATELIGREAAVLYPGSYVDIAPSVWFDDVTYVDTDKRAHRFFSQTEQVADLISKKRSSAGVSIEPAPTIRFEPADYRDPLPTEPQSIDVLVSLYAGFISEHCTEYLRPGGLLLTNNSHGDASMASLDPGYELHAVITSRDGDYKVNTQGLDRYLIPKRGEPPTIGELHEQQRGIAYTTSPFVYLFLKT